MLHKMSYRTEKEQEQLATMVGVTGNNGHVREVSVQSRVCKLVLNTQPELQVHVKPGIISYFLYTVYAKAPLGAAVLAAKC